MPVRRMDNETFAGIEMHVVQKRTRQKIREIIKIDNMEAAERARQILAKHRNFQSSNPQQQQMLDECFVFAFVKGANWKEATTDEEILEEIVKGNNWYNTNEPFQLEVEIVDDSKRAEIEDTILRLLFKKGELIPGLRINKAYKQSLDIKTFDSDDLDFDVLEAEELIEKLNE